MASLPAISALGLFIGLVERESRDTSPFLIFAVVTRHPRLDREYDLDEHLLPVPNPSGGEALYFLFRGCMDARREYVDCLVRLA